jgi:TonB family protein
LLGPPRDKPPFVTHSFHAVAYVAYNVPRKRRRVRQSATWGRLERIEMLPRVFFTAPTGPIIGGLTSPVRIHEVKPEYTEQAKEARLEGTVELEMEVDTIGRPRNIKVVRGLGTGLDEEALKAVQQWWFIPGWKDNQAVAASVCVKANFKLPNAADA